MWRKALEHQEGADFCSTIVVIWELGTVVPNGDPISIWHLPNAGIMKRPMSKYRHIGNELKDNCKDLNACPNA